VLVLVDSIQTLFSREAGGQPGSVTQVRLCTGELVDWARRRDAAMLLVAHVTKEGIIAGPKLVEHMVDTVISFEEAGTEVRMLQAVKNRFGSVDEVGLFRMTEGGLAEVTDPSALFLVHREGGLPPGVAVAPVFEGSRVLLVEIQALVVPAKGGISRIYSDRIDSGRAARVAAVLEKHLGARFSELDLYVNVAGGIRIAEVGVELPLALALYSAKMGVPLPDRLAVTGEVSLAGEVRPVSGIEKRLRACLEMGFAPLVGPLARPDGSAAKRSAPLEGLAAVAHVRDAVKKVFGGDAPKGGAG
jgi:DNA repair protein RadA/Sms